MKAESKARLTRYGRSVVNFMKDWALPIFGGMTIGAAWSGHVRSSRLEKELIKT